ncbi:hypothetical protein NET02_11570 [Thermomicrobiaceae bacterium CFH 74404]|uniref:Uncharacterized protein n=1 Tax=Thermalbibacter longus TaxID=2951981 RepID=A0AA42BBF8_9BACT|nr:hypothetical protein [Thermalbibacter longus]MCM8749789.1 hypothetical protein [Thermalbibacter longus]
MKLTRHEMETHAWLNAAEEHAEVFTEIPADIRYWRRIAQTDPAVKVSETAYGIRVSLPKARLKVSYRSRRTRKGS